MAISLRSVKAFQSAFRVDPEIAEETRRFNGLGVYGWTTPAMEGFRLPETEELVLALHLGGSRRVRAITDEGLSRTCSVPGLLTLLPPGRAAAFRTEGSISLVSLHIPRAAIGSAQFESLVSRDDFAAPSRFAFQDAFVSSAMEALLRAARTRHASNDDYMAKVTEALLCHLGRWRPASYSLSAPRGVPVPRLGRLPLDTLLAHVEQHLGRKLGLCEMAAKAGLSRAAFTRDFKSAQGISFHRYLQTRRIAAAQKMLRETDLKLAFVAQDHGFSSQSHFTAVFKSIANCTPQQYRQRG